MLSDLPDVRFRRRERMATARVQRERALPIDGSESYARAGWLLGLPPEGRDLTVEALKAVSERSRQDPGCVDYWWAEDLEQPCRFHFFECWESEEAFDAHQAQPYEHDFMVDHVSRIVGADATVLTIGARTSAMGS